MRRSAFLLGLGSAFTLAGGPARSDSELDRYMSPHVEMAEFRGIVVIAPRGRSQTVATYGGAYDRVSRFRVASVAKGFTAATIAALVDAEKVRLDDRLGKFLKPFAASTITIRQLLDHESGVPDIYSMPAFARGHRDPISKSDYISLLATATPAFEPGKQSAYSNSGYSLLAFAIESITEQPFATTQRRLVLDPAGLQDTDVLPGTAVVHGADPGAPNSTRPAEPLDPSWLIGNGSLYSTAADLQKWLGLVVAGKTVRTRSWPYPWGWGKVRNGRGLDADGRYSGYACDARVDLDSGDAVIVLSAVQSAVVDAIGRDLFASIAGAPLKPAALRTFATLSSVEASEYDGVYQLSSDFSVSVRSFGDAVQVAGPDGAPEALDPLGKDRFYFRVLDTGLTFKRNAAGKVTSIDWGPGAFTLSRKL